MQTHTTKEEFSKAVNRLAEQFAAEVWEELVEGEKVTEQADVWMRERGGELVRRVLGQALTSRSERVGVGGWCECGGRVEFRQHRPFQLHTVLAGRDVDVWAVYGQCGCCHKGHWPLLRQMKVDREGFTQALQELSLLAGVIEPYGSASGELLGKFAGVVVSSEKIQSLVRQDGAKASRFIKHQECDLPIESGGESDKAPLYVEIDGGMIHVEGRWQEVKLGCVFGAEETTGKKGKRVELTQRRVVAIRGKPDQLAEVLWPLSVAAGADHRPVVVVGDGAPWIWNLAELFGRRVEILDWYHADEHISHMGRVLYGEGTSKAEEFRAAQLDRLANDRVEDVIEALRFLSRRQRSAYKRNEIDKLLGYLIKNRHRMMYRTFRQLGYSIGSGAVESAVNHVVQQRMKRPGMRWKADGADAMLALRSVYRSHGAWDSFWAYRAA
jgi:hypothetical protein